jgi:RimJ/RimL family protein N-acetyltransferase
LYAAGAPPRRWGDHAPFDDGEVFLDTLVVDLAALTREFDREIVLKDGARIRLRPILPGDEASLVALHGRLSQQSAYQRFFTIMRRLPLNWAHYLANVDYERRLALVAVEPGTGDVVGVARYEATSDPRTVEVALVVQDSWQNRGLGTRLFAQLLHAATLNGVERFRAWVLADNRRMVDLIARFGVIGERHLEQGVVELLFTAPASARVTPR